MNKKIYVTLTYPEPNLDHACVYAFIRAKKKHKFVTDAKKLASAVAGRLDMIMTENDGLIIASAVLPYCRDIDIAGHAYPYPADDTIYTNRRMCSEALSKRYIEEGLIIHQEDRLRNVEVLEQVRVVFDEYAKFLGLDIIWDDPEFSRKMQIMHPFAEMRSHRYIHNAERSEDRLLKIARDYAWAPMHPRDDYIDDLIDRADEALCLTKVIEELYEQEGGIRHADAGFLNGVVTHPDTGEKSITLVITQPNGRADALRMAERTLDPFCGFDDSVSVRIDKTNDENHADVLFIMFQREDDSRLYDPAFRDAVKSNLEDMFDGMGWSTIWHDDTWAKEQRNVSKFEDMCADMTGNETNGQHYFGNPEFWPYIRVKDQPTKRGRESISLDITIQEPDKPTYMLGAIFDSPEQYRAWLDCAYGTWPVD